MKKFMIVPLLVALVAGAWTPLVKADAKSDLQAASSIAQLINSGGIDPVLNLVYKPYPAIKTVVKLGTTSITTAAALSVTVDTFQDKTKKAIGDLQTAAKVLNDASNTVKNATTAQQQIDALMAYLQAQGKFIDVIATYMADLNTNIFNPVFSLIEAMPYVGDKVVVSGKPVSALVGSILTRLKEKNDTFIKAVAVLPTVIKSVEQKAAAGTTSTAAPEVKAADFGF
jgi:hypothetical protein